VKTHMKFITAISLAVCAATVAAQTNEPTVIVTANRIRRDRALVPASVSVLSAAELQATPSANVDDALRSIPGVTVMRGVGIGHGMPTQILLRGVPGDHRVLLLADGMPLNEALTRFNNVNEITISTVRQIEVIKGPFSSLYGTDAFAGVVNITTKEPPEQSEAEVRALYGNGGFYEGTIQYGNRVDKLRYLVELGYRSIDNYLARDYEIDRRYDYATGRYVDTIIDQANHNYRDTRALVKLSADLNEDTQVAINARWFDSQLGYGQTDRAPFYTTPEDDITETRGATVGASMLSTLSPDVDIRLGGYYRKQTRDLWALDFSHFSGPAPVYVRSYMDNSGTEWQLEAALDLEFGEAHIMSVGADYTRSAAEFSPNRNLASGEPLAGSEGISPLVWNAGLFIQDDARLAEHLRIVYGTRTDYHSQFGKVFSPRAGIVCNAIQDTTIRASVGRAFRAPTLVEMFQPSLSFGMYTFVANPDLQPEYISAADLEVEHRFNAALSANLSVFYNDMNDLIENQITGDTLSNINIDQARSAGAEASVSWQVTQPVELFVGATYQDAKNLVTDSKLEYIPGSMANVGLRIDESAGMWQITGSVVARYIGPRGFSDWASGQWIDLNDYWSADLALRGTFNSRYWAGLNVRNATDEKYQESRLEPLAPGRMVSFELGARI
jgi:iron complex outermembrane receptor protein